MRRIALVVLLVSCGPKPIDTSFPTKPLGELVGSWSAARGAEVLAVESHLDINADGTFSEAWIDPAGQPICTRQGTVSRTTDDQLWFQFNAYRDTCVPLCEVCSSTDNDYSPNLSSVTADEFVFTQDGDDFVWTYRRQPGPLVPDELLGVDHWPKDETVAVEDPPSTYEPPSTYDGPVTHEDPWFSTLRQDADVLAKVVLQDSYSCASSGRSEHSGARWSVRPLVSANTRYEIVILVPKDGGDASGSLEMGGDTLAMEREESDDGKLWVLWQYATVGEDGYEPVADGGLGVDFEDDEAVASMLLACSGVE